MIYQNARDTVLKELTLTLESVDEKTVEELANAIIGARKVFVVGVGRVLLMLQAFVKRLNHLGIEANFVGAIDEPAITEDDLLIVGSGSGESIVPLEITKLAKLKYHAKVAHIGSNANSSMTPLEDIFLRLPCRTKLNYDDEIDSKQPMSSLFEQSLLLIGDIIAMIIIEKKQITDIHSLWQKHANLE